MVRPQTANQGRMYEPRDLLYKDPHTVMASASTNTSLLGLPYSHHPLSHKNSFTDLKYDLKDRKPPL
jgi:hypothetical protein